MSGGRFFGLQCLVLAAFLVSAIVLGAAGTGIDDGTGRRQLDPNDRQTLDGGRNIVERDDARP